MRDRLQCAFSTVRAEENLKAKTLAAVARRSQRQKRKPLAWAAACLIFLLAMVGGGLFFTPVLVISIDINPSLELTVNRFNRVIGVEGFNEEGRELAQKIRMPFADYSQALTALFSNAEVQALLEQGGHLSVFVACDDEQRGSETLSNVKACAGHRRNVYCHAGGWAEFSAAHEAGLSCGKYRAFLKLQALDPDVAPEDVQELTMREIQERIAEISGEGPAGEGCGNGRGYGGKHGHHNME